MFNLICLKKPVGKDISVAALITLNIGKSINLLKKTCWAFHTTKYFSKDIFFLWQSTFFVRYDTNNSLYYIFSSAHSLCFWWKYILYNGKNCLKFLMEKGDNFHSGIVWNAPWPILFSIFIKFLNQGCTKIQNDIA